MHKSTICWLLSRAKHTLSSDRLTRVKQSELVSKGKFLFQNLLINQILKKKQLTEKNVFYFLVHSDRDRAISKNLITNGN